MLCEKCSGRMLFEKSVVLDDKESFTIWQLHCVLCGIYLDPTIAKNQGSDAAGLRQEDFKKNHPDTNVYDPSSMTVLVNQVIPRGWTEKHFRKIVHTTSYFHMHMDRRHWATHTDSVYAGAVAYFDACREHHQSKSSVSNLVRWTDPS